MRFWLPLFAASLLALLNGCGSSSSNSGNGTIRLVNATPSGSVDFYNSTTLLSSGIVAGGASGYASLVAGAYPFFVNTAGTATSINGSTRTVTAAVASTLVVYNTLGVTNSALLTDNQGAPSAGAAAFRIFNTSNEAGTVDVYVTAPTVTDLSTVSPIATGVLSTRLSGYAEISAGTYRVRVTATGDKSDVRLDLPAVPLANQEVSTFVLTSATGGTLVNAVNIDQLGATTNYVNPSARVRLVADAVGGATVAATVNGVSLGSFPSPALGGSYTLVPAGALTTTATIGGTTVAVPAGLTATAGSDLSLLVGGTAAAPAIRLLADDNSVPTVATQTKVRLVNGVNGYSGALTLTANFSVVGANVAFGTASTAVTNVLGSTSASDTRSLQVTGPGFVTQTLAAVLSPAHVYTVFVLGDSTSPQVVPRQDR